MMISTLFKRISLINLLPRLLQRNISYVERVRFLQQLKEQDTVCSSHIPGGKFLLYSQSKPLIHVDKANTEDVLLWLTYSEVTEYYPQVLSSSVLVDVNEDGTPRYSVQVGALPTTTQDKLESATGAVFTDLRLALFMVSWRDAHTLSRANNVLMWNKNNAFCGKCGAPTARNAAGETLEETVHREVAEEVGIEVSSVRYVASQHWPFPGSLMAGCFAVAEKQQLTKDNNELQDARWFSRDEVSTALDKINANPHLRLRGNPSGELFIPPPGAIAYHLIAHWIKGTPVQEIYQHIY
ncbi:NAD(P)H pyrophosphatase NUDT13, mitochondrial-like isoform X2 [Homarus americanus]|uniref:NAD(P)H pyrophosphatase NUDT13, mitochondrial-like isoform X2 n=1 Tax=Homarus americanus TaxID=6706 RepID=UPI001C45E081|nr:NAD(P)H pyrophosphatase NUDT13, mitochondrial-like isoform X2 [Homarus americanus]